MNSHGPPKEKLKQENLADTDKPSVLWPVSLQQRPACRTEDGLAVCQSRSTIAQPITSGTPGRAPSGRWQSARNSSAQHLT